MSSKLRYGLIGCGGCGENKHLSAYEKMTEDITVAAVFDTDVAKARAVAKRHNVPTVYTRAEDLIADRSIDLVSIVTPNVFHAPLTIAALKTGKHVHVEKPIAMNAREAQAIVAAKNRARRLVMVGLNNRFTDAAQYAKKYIAKGHLGEIYHARCAWRRRTGFNMFGTWFADKKLSGGGPLIDLGVHFFDLTLYLMGFPAPTAVSGQCYDKLAHPREKALLKTSAMLGRKNARGKFTVEDIAVGFVKLETGASVAFEFSWASHVEKETTFLELLGTRGGLRIQDGAIKIMTEAAGEVVDVNPVLSGKNSGWGDRESHHFVDCIKSGRTPLAPPEEAVKMMQIIDAIYASSNSGHEILIRKKK